MKSDTLFYRLFQRWPQLAMELLNLPYKGDHYRFVSEEIKQTAFRMDGIFKPSVDYPDTRLFLLKYNISRMPIFTHVFLAKSRFIYIGKNPRIAGLH